MSKQSKQKGMTLKEAYETMLKSAKNNLERANVKKNEWDIEHYTNAVKIIEQHLTNL